MSRFPPCPHGRQGIVTSGGPGQAHAATDICERPSCIADAIEWAEAITGLPAAYRPDLPAQPRLFPVS